MTVVVNHDTNSVIWCAIGFGSEVLSQFFECLTEEQRASIRCITADGARWIASCISEYCPNAQRCIDPFHVVSWAMEALEKVRRRTLAATSSKVGPSEKRKPGRPRKGEKVESAAKKSEGSKIHQICIAQESRKSVFRTERTGGISVQGESPIISGISAYHNLYAVDALGYGAHSNFKNKGLSSILCKLP